MNAPTTQREEIRQVLAASDVSLTRPEIFARCKLLADEKILSTMLSQMVRNGMIRRAGERPREKGAPLALYGPSKAGAGQAASGHKKPRAARAGRSKPLPKVQRKTATLPDPDDFRCGIFSDGTLEITTKDGQISLTEPETRAMFSYLDRVLGNAAA